MGRNEAARRAPRVSMWVMALLVVAGVGCASSPRLLDQYGWHVPAMGVTSPARALLASGNAVGGHCAALDNPWRGPALCGYDAVLRPGRRECTTYTDASPNLDPIGGWYRAERDRHNWVSPRQFPGRVLQLLGAYVIDNGEGEGAPHGPHGNLYWDLFSPDEPLWRSPDGRAERRLLPPRVLRGPHRTHGRTDEWLDDEAVLYSHAGLYVWGTTAGTDEAITVRVFESDGSEDGFLGRRNDVLGMERIRRSDTETPCGVWIPFHRYDNSHPRRRTERIALWLHLRTWPTRDGAPTYADALGSR